MRVVHHGVHVIFSCIEDCLAFNLVRFTVNWPYVADYVLGGWTNGESRSLNELDQVTRGECIEIDTTSNRLTRRQFYWKPSTFALGPHLLEDTRVAATLLRRTVRHCVRTWAGCYESLLVRLSGGLDSSIVLGCLGGQGSVASGRVTCLAYYGSNVGADPRRWARLAAHHVRTELIEVPVDARHVGLEPLLNAAPTPVPAPLVSYYLANRIEREVVRDRAVTAILTGEGGDPGFGSLSIGRAIDEMIRNHGFIFRTIQLAAQIAAIRDTTTLRVLADALRRRAFGTRLRDNARLFDKLGQMASYDTRRTALAYDHYPHPWFREEAGVPWGLVYRLGMLLTAPEFYDPFPASGGHQANLVHPLYSQPVVELCLRIPLYVHFLNGRDRGLARNAFTAEVPKEILQRQWKDRGANVNEELVAKNLVFLRSVLLDGVLVREGILDRIAIERALSNTPTKAAAELPVILHDLAIELWVRKWSNCAASAAA
ncbi:asparagine synthase C-terminal domain-containing protein [Dyella monticola]|nr:asparagine synthase C-terminal domain-containing protein [Dyella monticola]